MPWVKFTQDWDFVTRSKRKGYMIMLPFKAGEKRLVSREIEERAVAAGVACEVERD